MKFEAIEQNNQSNLFSDLNPVFNHDPLAPFTVEDIISDLKKNTESLEKSKLKPIPKPTEENWQDVLETLKIRPDKNYTEPPICIQFEENGKLSRFATFGNFSAVIGKAKSRKTFLISLILGAAIKTAN